MKTVKFFLLFMVAAFLVMSCSKPDVATSDDQDAIISIRTDIIEEEVIGVLPISSLQSYLDAYFLNNYGVEADWLFYPTSNPNVFRYVSEDGEYWGYIEYLGNGLYTVYEYQTPGIIEEEVIGV